MIGTYDTIWVELWQPWRVRAAGFHNVSKDVHVLAGACSYSIRLQFDALCICSHP